MIFFGTIIHSRFRTVEMHNTGEITKVKDGSVWKIKGNKTNYLGFVNSTITEGGQIHLHLMAAMLT